MANINVALNRYLAAKKAYENHNKRNRPHTMNNWLRLVGLHNNLHQAQRRLITALGTPVYGLLPANQVHQYPYGFGYNIPAFKNALQRVLGSRAARSAAGLARTRNILPANMRRHIARHA